jgi:hypothetical protein
MLFFKLIYLYIYICRYEKKTLVPFTSRPDCGLWALTLQRNPLQELRIHDLTPELTCEAPLLNYITFQAKLTA